jgi:hypothetical protein
VEVLAEVTPETTTCISTDIVPATLPLTGDDLSELIDERAAIMEHDGGLGREVADRLAAEMIMGRGASAPLAPPEAVGVDHPGLMARMHPLVDQAVQRFGGTVRLLHEDEDPFRTGWGVKRKIPEGCCQKCGSSRFVDVWFHDGQSARQDCDVCGAFVRHLVWYGKSLVPSPVDVQPTGPGAVPKTNRLSFLAPMPAVPDLLHAG